MHRRTIQRWLIWLLPLLLLRAFVPAGFMVSHGAAGWQLVFCGGLAVQASAHAQHEHHDHHADQHEAPQSEAPSGHSHLSACPFSLVSSTATAAVQPGAADAVVPSDERIQPDAAPGGGIASTSAHRIRGPPRLS